MTKLSALATASFLAVGLLVNATPAKSASLEGTFNLEPAQGGAGQVSGVIFTGFGVSVDGNPLTSLDWITPQPLFNLITGCATFPTQYCADFQDRGGAFVSAGFLDFAGFPGLPVLIKDLPEDPANPNDPPGNPDGFPGGAPPLVINDFISGVDAAFLGNPDGQGFTLDLTALNNPQYTSIALPGGGTGTNVALGIEGRLYTLECIGGPGTCINANLNDPTAVVRSSDFTNYTGSINFVFNRSPNEVRSLVDTLGEQFGPNTFSFQISSNAAPVPEASNLTGLIGLGLVGSWSFLRKIKRSKV